MAQAASKERMNNLSDDTIMERVLGGHTEAFGVWVDRYSAKVFSLTVRICGSREDAEEIVQDTFVKVYRNLHKFRGNSSFSSWMYRIAYNAAISHLRKNKMPRFSELQQERFGGADHREEVFPDAAEESWLREVRLDRLEKALQLLDPPDRAMLLFFYQEEKSIREIAGIVSLTENNVKIRLHRLRKKLAVIYEKMEP